MNAIQSQGANSICNTHRVGHDAFPGLLGTDPHNPTNAEVRMVGGKALFENDNFRITAGENHKVSITNKHTGESYQVDGPCVDVDGRHAFDLNGTGALQLEDGTQVTIGTAPDPRNPDAMVPSEVTITNGDYGTKISGLASGCPGDMNILESPYLGRLADALTPDGGGDGFLGVDRGAQTRKDDRTGMDSRPPHTDVDIDKLNNIAEQLIDMYMGDRASERRQFGVN